jgi:hypothetical protein
MSSICHRSCDTCNMQLHCQGCSYCEMPLCKKDCFQCFSLCPCRGGSFAHLKALGGGEVQLLGNDRYNLPNHIPILPDRLTEPLKVNEVIGVHSGNMFSSNGEKINPRFKDQTLQQVLGIENPVEGVLEFYIKDRTLEGFWDKRAEIYPELARFKWRAVIAPNFSVYEDAPRVDHLYNMKRSSIVYNEMIQHGLPAVPDISWYNQIDLDQWIREINTNKVQTISFSFQVVDTRLKASNLWKHYLMGFKYLCQRIGDVQIVVAGVVSPDRLKAIAKAAGGKRIIILNQTAYLQSRRGIFSSTGYKAPSNMSKNEILLQNLSYYDERYKENNWEGETDAENEK